MKDYNSKNVLNIVVNFQFVNLSKWSFAMLGSLLTMTCSTSPNIYLV